MILYFTFVRSSHKFETTAKEAPGNRGYKYFGAAKDLPGVRELFNQEPPALPKKTRAELMRSIDADYYGYRDEDDGVILKEEAKIQREELLKLTKADSDSNAQTIQQRIEQLCSNEANKIESNLDFSGPKNFISHVPSIPSQEEIHEELIRRKKQELLEKYVSTDVIESEKTAKTLLGIE